MWFIASEEAFRGHHLANQLVCDTSIPSSSRSVHACPPGILKTEAYRYYFSEAVPLLSRQNHLEGPGVDLGFS